MATSPINIPDLPQGFELSDNTSSDIPSLPQGFQIESKQESPGVFIKHPIGRHILRSGARAFESLAGLPGDIARLGQLGSAKLASKLSGKPEEEFIKPIPLPSKEDIREFGKKLTKGELEPRSPIEEFADDVIEFTSPFLLPLKGVGSIDKAKKIGTTFLKGIGATAVGKSIQGLTGSEPAGTSAQIGSYLIMSLFNPRGMSKFLGNIYKDARKSIPKDALVSTNSYINKLENIENEIKSSLSPSESQKKILSKIEEIKKSTASEVNPNVILDTKQSINEDLVRLMKDADKGERKRLAAYMKRISGITNDTLKEYGETNPKFWELQSAADEAFATKAQSEWIARGIEKALGGKQYPHLEKVFPFLIHGAGKIVPALGGVAGASTTPAYFLSRFAYRYAKSSTLRKYYNQLMLGGFNGNKKEILEAAENVENALK